MATSYSTICGSGDRRDVIYPTSSTGWSAVTIAVLIDNNSSTGLLFTSPGAAASAHWVQFYFGYPYVIDEATLSFDLAGFPSGNWKWQGSNDGSAWTDIGGTFVFGNATTQVVTTLSGNTTAYSYYRMLGVSGTVQGIAKLTNVDFKCSEEPEGAVTSYANPGGSGNRTGMITASNSASLFGTGVVSTLIDGVTGANNLFFNATAAAGNHMTFDFGAPLIINEVKWIDNIDGYHGWWQFQGSPDNSVWTAGCGPPFQLGLTATQTIRAPRQNITAYRYYRLLGVAGTKSNGPYLREVEFKVAGAAAAISAARFAGNHLIGGGYVS